METPCYKCNERTLGCHTSCSEYEKYKLFIKKARDKQHEESLINSYVAQTKDRMTALKER